MSTYYTAEIEIGETPPWMRMHHITWLINMGKFDCLKETHETIGRWLKKNVDGDVKTDKDGFYHAEPASLKRNIVGPVHYDANYQWNLEGQYYHGYVITERRNDA